MDKPLCRWCANELRKSTRDRKVAYRHVVDDNGHCEAMRRIITGDAKTAIEPA